MNAHGLARKYRKRLRHQRLGYWIADLVLIVLGVAIAQYIDDNHLWTDARYAATQHLQDLLGSVRKSLFPLYPKRTALVFVDDDDYWTERLAGRSPIKRDYLACLVDALDKANADVIALDFDLRSPRPENPRDFTLYEEETHTLVNTINDVVAKHQRRVVLATSVGFAPGSDGYVEHANVYENLILPRVSRGYVQLPYDVRRVPLPLALDTGNKTTQPPPTVDSFATAIVKRVDPVAYSRTVDKGRDQLPFAGYIPPEAFSLPGSKQPGVSAREVLSNSAAAQEYVRGKIAIVSGVWNSRASGAGPRVDLHPSPAGLVPGAMIHADYVEAMLNDRAFSPLPKWFAYTVEIVPVLLLSPVIVMTLSRWLQLVVIVGATLFMLVLNFFLQDLGMFFDFFVPTVMLLGHVVAHKIYEWWQIAHSMEAASHV
jgi:CHASE2 domain-containing sensor protein